MRSLPPAIVLLLAGLTAWPAAQDQPPGDHRWPCVGAPDPTYIDTADATGGQVFFFAPEDLAQSAVLMTQGDRHDQAVIRHRGRLERTSERTFDVPIDGGVESAFFSVTLQCADEVQITTPRGDEAAQVVTVDDQRFRGGRIVVVPAPIDGMWRVRMRGRGAYMVSVQVRGGVQLERVRFLGAGAPEVPLDPPLRLGQEMEIEVTLEGDVFQAAFEMRTTEASGNTQFRHLDLPEVARDDRRITFRGGPVKVRGPYPFRLHVTGMAAAGRAFQRVQPGLVPVVKN